MSHFIMNFPFFLKRLVGVYIHQLFFKSKVRQCKKEVNGFMKNVSITIRIAEVEKDRLIELAQSKDVPASQIVREAIKKYLEEVN